MRVASYAMLPSQSLVCSPVTLQDRPRTVQSSMAMNGLMLLSSSPSPCLGREYTSFVPQTNDDLRPELEPFHRTLVFISGTAPKVSSGNFAIELTAALAVFVPRLRHYNYQGGNVLYQILARRWTPGPGSHREKTTLARGAGNLVLLCCCSRSARIQEMSVSHLQEAAT